MARLRSYPSWLLGAGLAALALVFACPPAKPVEPQTKTAPLGVTFVAPYDGQRDVPASTRVWIRASGALTADQARGLFRLTSEAGDPVEAGLQLTQDSQAAVLSPAAPLQPGRTYKVVFRRPGADGGAGTDEVVSTFATRAERTDSQNGGFQVKAVLPMDAPGLSVWPFSTFHVLLSEPARVDSVTAASGPGLKPSVQLLHLANGRTVPVDIDVIVRGSTVAIDPRADLQPNETYILVLYSDVRDLAGEPLDLHFSVFEVKPLAAMRKVALALQAPPTSADEAPATAKLETRALNTLELRSALVGPNTLSLEGTLQSELPDPSQHGAHLPLVIRKGQVLTARGPDNGGLAIRLGGQIDTTLNSGPLSLTIVTDGSGEIMENPYALAGDASRPLVRMTLDAALTAGNPTVNAMLSQDLLTLQMVGALYVKDGRLGVELVAAAELDLLGLETGASSVSISAWSAEAPAPASPEPMTVQTIAPALATDSASDGGGEADRDQLFEVVFSQPPEQSARSYVRLEHALGDGGVQVVPTTQEIQGAVVLLRPQELLTPGDPYVVRVDPGVRGIGGGALADGREALFTVRPVSPNAPRPTLLTSLRPGVPCAFLAGGADRQCAPDSAPEAPFTLPANLPIEARFSKPVLASSVRLGQTVDVLDLDGGARVPGRLKTGTDWLQFIPDEPWQAGHPYVVRLGGSGDGGCGRSALCELDGGAVNTDILLDVTETAGGPPVEIAFTGDGTPGQSALTLFLSPAVDTNANGLADLDAGPPPRELRRDDNSVTLRAADGGFRDRTYLSGALLARVGRFDGDAGTMPLTVDVGSWMSGTSVKILNTDTDRLLVRPAGPQAGYLQANPDGGPPRLVMTLNAYMDSVNDTIQNTLPREPLQFDLSGELRFTPDGRMMVELSNSNVAKLTLQGGDLQYFINPGDVHVRAISGALGR